MDANSAVFSQQTSMSLNRIQFLTQKTLLPPSVHFLSRDSTIDTESCCGFEQVIRL